MALTLDGDNGISGINGSAATPAIQGADTNTGLTFGTDTVGVVTGGSTRTTVDSGGRLLVGTTSPVVSDTKVEIKGNNSGSGGGKLTIAATANWQDSGDLIGAVYFANNLGGTPATIEALGDGFGASGDYPSRLVFSTTADGASSSSERFRIDQNGKTYFGGNFGSTPGYGANGAVINLTFDEQAGGSPGDYYGVISINSASSTAYHYQFYTSTTRVGHIICSTSATTYATSSDYRLKENIVDLDGAIDRVKQLAPKRFNFTVDPGNIVDGFLAHEAQTVVPEAVTGAKDDVEVWKEGDELPDGVSVGDNKLDEDGNTIPVYQGIDQSKLVPLLTAALQEAIGKIEALETRVAQLEGGAA